MALSAILAQKETAKQGFYHNITMLKIDFISVLCYLMLVKIAGGSLWFCIQTAEPNTTTCLRTLTNIIIHGSLNTKYDFN